MRRGLLLLCLLFAFTGSGFAARIGDLVESAPMEQASRFISFHDPSVRIALTGSILLGICCGMLGSFLVVRRMALVGDVLSHAVLPGVALGFLWHMTKDPVAILVGATLAGLLGTSMVNWISRSTKLKEDTALGLVLASFFALGLCMTSMIQRLPTGAKSGLEKFLFGQASAMDGSDVQMIAGITLLTGLLLGIFYKEFLVLSFDPQFARICGIPVRLLHEAFMLLLAFAVVIALQAVGVVLVSAMLITPAAAAYMLTDRMHKMVLLSACFGALAAAVGAFISFLGDNLPTGPFMVLAASTIFLGAFLFAPKYGLFPRGWRRYGKGLRIQRENTLKALFQILEGQTSALNGVTLNELAIHRRGTIQEAGVDIEKLLRHGLAEYDKARGVAWLTEKGRRLAESIVRNHRLWELYLTSNANYPSDHVHDDAEKMEHILNEEIIRELERNLDFPETDPHGKTIP